jgi:hypothetical protein
MRHALLLADHNSISYDAMTTGVGTFVIGRNWSQTSSREDIGTFRTDFLPKILLIYDIEGKEIFKRPMLI